MPNIRRYLGLCVLCCHVVGCAGGYRTVDLAPTDPDTGRGNDNSPVLGPGDDLRLLLTDGVVVRGTLVRSEERALILRDVQTGSGSHDTFAELPRADDASAAAPVSYARADIVQIERFEANPGVDVAIAAVLIGCVAGLIYGMDHVLDDFGEP